MSLIDESGGRSVRMANLASVGSHAINGVAKLHTELLKKIVLRDFYELWPEKFSNKTNGVTPRRFMVSTNPGLTQLISRKIGEDWIRDLNQLKKLESFVEDGRFPRGVEAGQEDEQRSAWPMRFESAPESSSNRTRFSISRSSGFTSTSGNI